MSETEQVTCQGCGQTVDKHRCCGVKSGPQWVWTCEACILGGGMDCVFANVGRAIGNVRRAAATFQRAIDAERGGQP